MLLNLLLNGIPILKVKYTKFLGIFIDDRLTWKHHLKFVENKLSSANFIIKQIRHKINNASAIKLYDTLILPYLTYCNTIWGMLNKTNLKRIVRLQKRALRVCTGQFSRSSRDLFMHAGRLPFDSLNQFFLAKLVHQFFYDSSSLPLTIFTLFNRPSQIHSYQTRAADNLNLFIHYSRLDFRKNFIKINAPLLWNKIPLQIREIISIPLFKKQLKAHLLNNFLE